MRFHVFTGKVRCNEALYLLRRNFHGDCQLLNIAILNITEQVQHIT